MKKNLKTTITKLAIFAIVLGPTVLLGQDTATLVASNAAASKGSDNTLLYLTIAAIFLLLPLYMATRTYFYSFLHWNKRNSKTLALFILSAACVPLSAAETAATPPKFSFDWEYWTHLLLILIIILELALIVYFLFKSKQYLLQITDETKEAAVVRKQNSVWNRIWFKMNQFKPLSEEHNIDTGHNYDGIKELNNITPPWFTTAFVISIVFACIYLWRYHVSKSAPLSEDEFKAEMVAAEAAKQNYLKNQANLVDENSVKVMGISDIELGKDLFVKNCKSCHGDNAAGSPASIGPNLTDNYWIHGGDLPSIFKSIKYGWIEKGMQSWKDKFSPIQIAQIANYVYEVSGTNIPGGKEKQGELFEKGSSKIANDTAKMK